MRKLHFWDRILLVLSALAALLCGLLLVYASLPELGWAFLKGTFVEKLIMPGALLPMCAGLVSILLAVFLFLLPRRLFSRKRDFVVQKTENGELRIAVRAIENLVHRCVDMHEEARLSSMTVHTTGSGVVIDLCISLSNNISIPLAVASLQKQIKQYLLASSGIDVRQVRVSVETAVDAAEHSPYIVPAEEGEASLERKEKKKRPTHQRLFSKPDEPAVIPAAPKAEQPDGSAQTPAAEEAAPAPAQEESKETQMATEAQEALPPLSAEVQPTEEKEETSRE